MTNITTTEEQRLAYNKKTRDRHANRTEAQKIAERTRKKAHYHKTNSYRYNNAYSDAATSLIIKLRVEGLTGQRLFNRFHAVIPNRSAASVKNKTDYVYAHKMCG